MMRIAGLGMMAALGVLLSLPVEAQDGEGGGRRGRHRRMKKRGQMEEGRFGRMREAFRGARESGMSLEEIREFIKRIMARRREMAEHNEDGFRHRRMRVREMIKKRRGMMRGRRGGHDGPRRGPGMRDHDGPRKGPGMRDHDGPRRGPGMRDRRGPPHRGGFGGRRGPGRGGHGRRGGRGPRGR